MKITEAKEKLPLDFLTSTVSHSWEEVGNLKASIAGIKQTFSETDKVAKILQDLVDSYLICIGQLELFLDSKDYIDMPTEKELTEASQANSKFILKESDETNNAAQKIENLEDDDSTEIQAKLPDYRIDLEQTGDKIEIEVMPQENQDTDALEITEVEDKPEEVTDNSFEYFTDFEEPVYDPQTAAEIQDWLAK